MKNKVKFFPDFKHFYAMLILFCSSLLSFGQDVRTINISSHRITLEAMDGSTPIREIKQVEDGVLVTYTFQYATLKKDPLYKDADFIQIKGFGQNDIAGEPCVLSRFDTFTIPKGKGCKVELIDSSYIELPLKLAPCRPPLRDGEYSKYSMQNVPNIRPFSGTIPNKFIKSDEKKPFRGYTLFDVKVSPVKYDYYHEKALIAKKISYKVCFIDKKAEDYNEMSFPTNKEDIDLLNAFTLNGTSEKTLFSNNRDFHYSIENPQLYLILSTPEYTSAVNTFAEWKRLLGFTVITELRDNWDETSIKNFILEHDDPISYLRYVLIIGSHNDVPAKLATDNIAFYSDNEYVKNVRNFPYIGRLPVSTLSEAFTVVNKIINYERNPTSDNNFYKTGLHCAYFQDENHDGYEDLYFTKTSEDILSFLENYWHFNVNRVYYAQNDANPHYWNTDFADWDTIPSYLMRSNGFLWNGSSQDIINKVNNGAFYVLHRGHGSGGSWGQPSFTKTNINSLSNQSKLPVVFSINCQTGNFAHTNSIKCFSEAFLTKNNGGCVGIFGATSDVYTGYDDVLTYGMFYSIWPNPALQPSFINVTPSYDVHNYWATRLGSILFCGRLRLKESGYGSAGYRQYTSDVFHCLGDPSMNMHIKIPKAYTDIQVIPNSNGVEIEVPSGGEITLYNPTTKEVNAAFGFYKNYVGNIDGLILCVSNTNRIPYIVALDDITSQNQQESAEKRHSYQNRMVKILTESQTEKTKNVVLKRGSKSVVIKKQKNNRL